MTRIKVDFNNLVRDGQIRAYRDDAEGGQLAVGDVVEAYDPAEDLSYEARVMEVDTATGLVYLLPHWEPVEDGVEPTTTGWVFEWTWAGQATHTLAGSNPNPISLKVGLSTTSRSAGNLVHH